MSTPQLQAAADSTRTEAEVRAARDRFFILHSEPRAKRGMMAWGVFEREDATFSHCVRAFDTEIEAKAFLAAIKAAA